MASERPSAVSGTSTEWFVKTIQSQTEWLVLSLQDMLERGTPQRVVYSSSNVEQTLSRKRARRLSVFLYVMSVSVFALALGFHYAFVWRPCPKNFFHKCTTGCNNKQFLWIDYKMRHVLRK